jgi:hypothetical protein
MKFWKSVSTILLLSFTTLSNAAVIQFDFNGQLNSGSGSLASLNSSFNFQGAFDFGAPAASHYFFNDGDGQFDVYELQGSSSIFINSLINTNSISNGYNQGITIANNLTIYGDTAASTGVGNGGTVDLFAFHAEGIIANGNEYDLYIEYFFDDNTFFDNSQPANMVSGVPLFIRSVLYDYDSVLDVDNGEIFGTISSSSVSAVPLPATLWLLSSGILTLIGIARRKNIAL